MFKIWHFTTGKLNSFKGNFAQVMKKCRQNWPIILARINIITSWIWRYIALPLYVFLKYLFPILVIVVAIIYYFRLVSLYESNQTLFWQETSIIIGATAALFAGIAAAIALGSLRLTRASQRPFLTVVEEPTYPQVIAVKDNPRVLCRIQNTGNLPADRTSIICALRTSTNDAFTVLKHSELDLAPSIYFPGVEVEHTFYMTTEQFHELSKGEFAIQINIKYENKVGEKDCQTIRTFSYVLSKAVMSPINTAHKDDKWT